LNINKFTHEYLSTEKEEHTQSMASKLNYCMWIVNCIKWCMGNK